MTPFEDNFDDGDKVGWAAWFGTWSAANLYLEKTSTGDTGYVGHSQTDEDTELTFSYYFEDTTISTAWLRVHPRYDNWNNQVYIEFRPGDMKMIQRDLAVQTTLDSSTATTAQATWYDVRIEVDGANVTVWRKQRDTNELYVEVMSSTAATQTTSTTFTFSMGPGAPRRIDDFRMLSDVRTSTTTYVYNLANELTSMTDYNGVTTFTYDDFGRTTSKTWGTASATYTWRYGHKLADYTSSFLGEEDFVHDYRGDGRLHKQTEGSSVGIVKWGRDNIVSREHADGTIWMTHVRELAHVYWSSSSEYSYFYALLDGSRSLRALVNEQKDVLLLLDAEAEPQNVDELTVPNYTNLQDLSSDPAAAIYSSSFSAIPALFEARSPFVCVTCGPLPKLPCSAQEIAVCKTKCQSKGDAYLSCRRILPIPCYGWLVKCKCQKKCPPLPRPDPPEIHKDHDHNKWQPHIHVYKWHQGPPPKCERSQKRLTFPWPGC